MTKKQRAETVMTELEKLYPQVPIPFRPLRPLYTFSCCSSFCTDNGQKVNEVTPMLLQKHTPQQMARLEEFEIKELIKELACLILRPKI
jgi:endonuclease-3